MINELKEKLINRTFDEYDIRRFLRLFSRNKEFIYLAAFEQLCKVRQKDKLLKMFELADTFETEKQTYLIINSSHEDKLYQYLSNELKEFGKQTDIYMDDQTIKEIILCIYSLMQFTNKYIDARLCLIQSEDSISLATLKDNIIITQSTLLNVQHYKRFDQGLITDPVIVKRIEGKLNIINFNHEMISRLE